MYLCDGAGRGWGLPRLRAGVPSPLSWLLPVRGWHSSSSFWKWGKGGLETMSVIDCCITTFPKFSGFKQPLLILPLRLWPPGQPSGMRLSWFRLQGQVRMASCRDVELSGWQDHWAFSCFLQLGGPRSSKCGERVIRGAHGGEQVLPRSQPCHSLSSQWPQWSSSQHQGKWEGEVVREVKKGRQGRWPTTGRLSNLTQSRWGGTGIRTYMLPLTTEAWSLKS